MKINTFENNEYIFTWVYVGYDQEDMTVPQVFHYFHILCFDVTVLQLQLSYSLLEYNKDRKAVHLKGKQKREMLLPQEYTAQSTLLNVSPAPVSLRGFSAAPRW